MKLKYRVSSIDEVPEDQRSLYVKNGTEYVLSVDLGGVGDPEAVARKNAELLTELRQAKDTLKQFDGIDPVKAAKAQQTVEEIERKRAEAAGDFESLRKQLVDKHAQEMGAVTTKLTKREAAIRKVVAEREAIDAIVALGAKPTVLLPHVMSHLEVVEEGDDFAVRVKSGNLVKVADGQGTPMTVRQFVAELKEHPDFADVFPGSGSSGTDAPARSRAATDDRPVKEMQVTSAEQLLANLDDIADGKVKIKD